jgi:hypothetical protein
MLDLRVLLEERNFKKASSMALELQESFKEAECLHGEAIAYYFLSQIIKETTN